MKQPLLAPLLCSVMTGSTASTALNAGEITLDSEGEVYRCSVIGPKE